MEKKQERFQSFSIVETVSRINRLMSIMIIKILTQSRITNMQIIESQSIFFWHCFSFPLYIFVQPYFSYYEKDTLKSGKMAFFLVSIISAHRTFCPIHRSKKKHFVLCVSFYVPFTFCDMFFHSLWLVFLFFIGFINDEW